MKDYFKKIRMSFRSAKSFAKEQYRLAMVAIATFILGVGNALAADPFEDATAKITGYIPSVQKMLYAIAAVVALVGAFNVYHKMTNGDQDVKKTIMLTLGGCIALVVLSTALPAFFGHTVTAPTN